MKLNPTFTALKTGICCLMLTFASACSSNTSEQAQEENPAGTSEAIVGEDPNLAEPRPAPIGTDTVENASQADQFGKMPENVDSAARGLR